MGGPSISGCSLPNRKQPPILERIASNGGARPPPAPLSLRLWVSTMAGIGSIAVDPKEKKLTVVGEVDAVDVVKKLRKVCHAHIVSVGPPEEKKKEEEKKKKEEEKKKEEPKKEEKDPKKAEEEMRKQMEELVSAYKAYNPHYTTHYIVHSAEENPNACVIC